MFSLYTHHAAFFLWVHFRCRWAIPRVWLGAYAEATLQGMQQRCTESGGPGHCGGGVSPIIARVAYQAWASRSVS